MFCLKTQKTRFFIDQKTVIYMLLLIFPGKNAESIGEDATLWAMMTYAPCISALLRQQIRKKHGIDGICESLKLQLIIFFCRWTLERHAFLVLLPLLRFCTRFSFFEKSNYLFILEAIQTGSIEYLLDDKKLNEGQQKYEQDIART